MIDHALFAGAMAEVLEGLGLIIAVVAVLAAITRRKGRR
jgi:hypothetical protein